MILYEAAVSMCMTDVTLFEYINIWVVISACKYYCPRAGCPDIFNVFVG